MINLALFDYDGLLIETEASSFEAWKTVYGIYGLELTAKEWSKAIGNLEFFDPKENIESKLGKSVGDVYSLKHQIHIELARELPLRPGVRDFIEILLKKNVRLGVVSNGRKSWIETGLARNNAIEYFDFIVSREMVLKHKPHPDGYLLALDHFEVPPREAIAFEDSSSGVLAACNAGIKVFAVSNEMTRFACFEGAASVVEEFSQYDYRDGLQL